ncbi:MAG: ribosome silencing factor [Pseudomonadota bacterium]
MTEPARRKADIIVAAAQEHKAQDLVLLRVDHLTSLADYFLICSGRSSRQVQALADRILEGARLNGGYRPLGIEGQSKGQWVLMDYGEVIVHVFYHETRDFYNLEGLWLGAHKIHLDSEPSRPDLIEAESWQ